MDTIAVRQVLDEMDSTLYTLRKLIRDTEPSYCTQAELARLSMASSYLDMTEDALAEVCASVNETLEVAGE